MKISRKDLRRIILESLNEKTLLKEVNLNAMFKDYRQLQQARDEEDEKKETKFMDKIRKHHADLKHSQVREKGPFRLDDSDQRKKYAERLLSLFTGVVRADTASELPEAPPPPAVAEEVNVPQAPAGAAPAPEPAEAPEASEWKKYRNEADWEYKIQGESPSEIWVTRKVGGDGTEYKLNKRRFKTTVAKLDADDVMDDRTQESIRNDPALKPAPASSSSSDSNDQPADTSVSSNNENSTNQKLKKIFDAGHKLLVAIPINKIKRRFTPGESSDPKIEINVEHRKLKEIESLEEFDKLANSGVIVNKQKGHTIRSKFDIYYNQEDKKMYFDGPLADNYSFGPYVPKNLNPASAAYVLVGVDLDAAVADAYDELNIEELENTPPRPAAAAAGVDGSSGLRENKVVYGESHATLMRKRYWGRY